MTITSGADLYGAIEDAGLDRLIGHMRSQRPALFNYASSGIAADPTKLCHPVDVDAGILDRGDPLVTTVDPLPVIGTETALEYCLQLTTFAFDFHESDQIDLPDGQTLADQEFGIQVSACGGLGCPDGEGPGIHPPLFEAWLPRLGGRTFVPTWSSSTRAVLDRATSASRIRTDGGSTNDPRSDGGDITFTADVGPRRSLDLSRSSPEARSTADRFPDGATNDRTRDRYARSVQSDPAVESVIRPRSATEAFGWHDNPWATPRFDPIPYPWPLPGTGPEMLCFCLDVFLTGAVDLVVREDRRVPTFEITDLELGNVETDTELVFPDGMREAIECYLDHLITLVLMPAVEEAVHESMQQLLGLPIVSLDLGADDPRIMFPETGSIPNNPAVEDNALKLWIDVAWSEVGS